MLPKIGIKLYNYSKFQKWKLRLICNLLKVNTKLFYISRGTKCAKYFHCHATDFIILHMGQMLQQSCHLWTYTNIFLEP